MTGATDLNISVQWNSLSLCRSSTSTCVFHKSKLYLWSLPKSAALPGAPYQKSGPPCTQLHQPKPNSSLLLVHHEILKPHGDSLPRISLSSTQHSQLPTHPLWTRLLHQLDRSFWMSPTMAVFVSCNSQAHGTGEKCF